MAICACGHDHQQTAYQTSDDKEPPYPSPYSSNNPHVGGGPPSQMNNHHTTCHRCEESPHLPPPFHDLDGCQGFLIYLTSILLHLTRFTTHIDTCPWCDKELPYLPTSNSDGYEQPPCATASSVADNHRLPPPRSSHNIPPIIHYHTDTQKVPSNYMENKHSFRVYTKAKTDFSLTIRDGKVILAPSNPSDPLQHWFKDEKFGKDMKDEEGFPSFALVNKATGQAMKYSIGFSYPARLTKYNPDELDITVLWSNGHSFGDGYSQIRPVNNMHLKLDACQGIENSGGVHDGTEIILWEWNNGDNQKWTIFPY